VEGRPPRGESHLVYERQECQLAASALPHQMDRLWVATVPASHTRIGFDLVQQNQRPSVLLKTPSAF
jgi:hypothetical protein